MPPRPIPHALDAAGTAVAAGEARAGLAYACPACEEPVQALRFQGDKAIWVHQDFVAGCAYTRGVAPEPPARDRAAAWLADAIGTREDLAVARRCMACEAPRRQALRAGGRVLRGRRDVELGGGLSGDVGILDAQDALRAVIVLVERAGVAPALQAALAGRPWVALAARDVLDMAASGEAATLVPVEDHFNPWRCAGCGHANGAPAGQGPQGG
ncbi:MAG: hypothetical protein VKS61_06485 [Candidatus Sericytochromatia bacterium]|nr:hypothetical protein [Candidatus Sericytochromatia bacterium]